MVTCPYICTCCLINTHTHPHTWWLACVCNVHVLTAEREKGIAWCARIASRIALPVGMLHVGGVLRRCAHGFGPAGIRKINPNSFITTSLLRECTRWRYQRMQYHLSAIRHFGVEALTTQPMCWGTAVVVPPQKANTAIPKTSSVAQYLNCVCLFYRLFYSKYFNCPFTIFIKILIT